MTTPDFHTEAAPDWNQVFYTGSPVTKAHSDDVGFDVTPQSVKVVFCDRSEIVLDCTISDDEFIDKLEESVLENRRKTVFYSGQRGIRKLVFDSGNAFEPRGNFWLMAVANSRVCKTSRYFLQNGVGIIDPGYRGTVRFCYLSVDPDFNMDEVLILKRTCGQLVPIPCVPNIDAVPVKHLSETERGTGGFGSSDKGAQNPCEVELPEGMTIEEAEDILRTMMNPNNE